MFLKSKLNLLIFFFSITLLLVLSSQDALATSSRKMPTAYIVHTYGDDTRAFQEGELATWEALTDINLTSITTTDQNSFGNTLYVANTVVFEEAEIDESTISIDGQILTITGVTPGVSLTVSDISGTIASGTAVQAGFVLTVYHDNNAPYNGELRKR